MGMSVRPLSLNSVTLTTRLCFAALLSFAFEFQESGVLPDGNIDVKLIDGTHRVYLARE
jgi:hypothetical protein